MYYLDYGDDDKMNVLKKGNPTTSWQVSFLNIFG